MVSSAITVSFKTYLDPGGYAWKFVSEEFKITYWNEFLKAFRWSPRLTDAKVYELWLARAAKRYSDHVSSIKSERYTRGRPVYMTEDIWENWCAYWDTDAAKERSERAKKNRLSEPDGPGSRVGKHRGDLGVLSHTPIRWLVIREFPSRILSTLPSRSYITASVIIATLARRRNVLLRR